MLPRKIAACQRVTTAGVPKEREKIAETGSSGK
jgi:hypothetical protein